VVLFKGDEIYAVAVMFEAIWFDDEVAFDFPMGICATKASHHASIWKPS
ncbi:Os01g0299100, partial [Oryza sativa Japonica Group]